MTQKELANAAGTSQPAIAAYETGARNPTWRTVQRIADAAGVICYPTVDGTLTRDQQRSLFLHTAIAEEINRRDITEVRTLAQRNLARMRSANPHAGRLLEEWEHILSGTKQRIMTRMLDPSEHGRDLRQVSPFAGVLTASQRVAVYEKFAGAS